MSIETVKCPQCGENASIDTDRDFGFCSYCGFKIEVSKPAVIPAEAPTADSLLARAQLFLEEKDYAKAEEYFNKALDINPYMSMAYIGLLTIKTNSVDIEKLSKKPQPIEEMADFKKAVRFAENEETRQRYINLAQKKQADFDLRWNEREENIKKSVEINQKKSDARYIEDLKASINRLNALITLVDIAKTLHAFCAAISIIATAIFGFALLGDLELILVFLPLLFVSGIFIGGVIGLGKLSDGLCKIYRAREDTLKSMI